MYLIIKIKLKKLFYRVRGDFPALLLFIGLLLFVCLLLFVGLLLFVELFIFLDLRFTYYDPNDTKGKQTAIFKAETYTEYRARLNGFQIQEPVKKEPDFSVTYHTSYANTLEPVKKEPEPSVTYEQYIASINLQEPVKKEPEPSVTYEPYISSRNLKNYNEYYVPYKPSRNRGQEFDN
jgi:hypothetical protein